MRPLSLVFLSLGGGENFDHAMADFFGDLDMPDELYEDDNDRVGATNYHETQPSSKRYFDGDEDEEYIRDGTFEGAVFPPTKPQDWDELPSNQIPTFTVDGPRAETTTLVSRKD